MNEEELILRFFGLYIHGIESYKTPQKRWLNEVAEKGRFYSDVEIERLRAAWASAIATSLKWFAPKECFRSSIEDPKWNINKAVFDLVSQTAAVRTAKAGEIKRGEIRRKLGALLQDEVFEDLIRRSVDHTTRFKKRFELWNREIGLT